MARVASLWIGGPLSRMEQVSIRSFLAAGYTYQLYCYDTPDGVPEGVEIRDASEIMARSEIFIHPIGGYAPFSNIWRYRLLFERGGWWVDTDLICLRPFPEGRPVVAGWQDGTIANNAVIWAEAGADWLAELLRIATPALAAREPYGLTAGWLFTGVLAQYGLMDWILPVEAFYPLPYSDWARVITPGEILEFPDSYSVHLWNLMWKLHGADKNLDYPGTWYGALESKVDEYKPKRGTA